MQQYATQLVAIFKLSVFLAFTWLPKSGSHQLALQRYKEKLNQTLMKILLKRSFLTEFSKIIVGKCPFFDRKKDFWQK